MMTCEFCGWVDDIKRQDARDNDGITHEYWCSLVVYEFRDGNEKGYARYYPRLLNYCPVCGRKMEVEHERHIQTDA